MFNYTKTQRDYSPDLVVQLLANIKETGALEGRETIYSEDNAKRFARQINERIKAVGVSPRHKGYGYLAEAIQLLYEGDENYKETIAARHNVTVKKVEDDMQYAIKSAWQNASIDDLLKYYTAPVNRNTGVPTVMEFIHFFYNEIKRDIE